MNWEALTQKTDDELETRKMEVVYAIQHSYPINRQELLDIEKIQRLRRNGGVLPLEAFQNC